MVRNHWVTKKDREQAGYFDKSIWEEAKKKGDVGLKRLIGGALKGTSVTAVLAGPDTYARRWVRYEIIRSIYKGNGVVAVHINGITGKNKRTKAAGPNPLDYLGLSYSADGKRVTPYEAKNRKWVEFADFAGYALETHAPVAKRGKFFKLSSMYKIYDWVADDGYENFATWV